MVYAVSRLSATAEYGPFALLHNCMLDVCLESLIKDLNQTHSHAHVGCSQNNTIPAKAQGTLKEGKEQGQNLPLGF